MSKPFCQGLIPRCLLQAPDETIFGSSWFHSMDPHEAACEEDCEELPYPEECDDPKAEKQCEKLRKAKGPLQVSANIPSMSYALYKGVKGFYHGSAPIGGLLG